MAIRARRSFVPFWYTPSRLDDEGKETNEGDGATAFRICGLNGEQIGHISPEVDLDDSGKVIKSISGTGITMALKFGLRDWRNVADEDGMEVRCSPVNFAYLPYDVRSELATQIVGASFPTDEERKN